MKKRAPIQTRKRINPRVEPRRQKAIMEEEEEGRKLAKERYLPHNLILTSNLVERERKMTTSKLAKCFSSNKRETEGM